MRSARTVVVSNRAGLHARPCHAIVAAALASSSDLRIRHGDRDVNGRSILELMTLNASRGTTLELVADGDDADDLVERLAGLFEAGFDEGD